MYTPQLRRSRAVAILRGDGPEQTVIPRICTQLKASRLNDDVARKTGEQRETERLLASSPKLRGRFNHRQTALLNHALREAGEGYRVDAHRRSHGVVYQTARNDLLQLEALGLLECSKQGNAFVFYAPDDLRGRLAVLAKSGAAR